MTRNLRVRICHSFIEWQTANAHKAEQALHFSSSPSHTSTRNVWHGLRHALAPHEVSTAFELGWSNLENGDLLREAEGRFEVFVTTDQNLRYQQNLGGRRLAILVLPTTNWPEIQRHQSEVAGAVNLMQPGDYRELHW